tara:strand:+ start:214755 stop:215516 length:762 start_codon:yes stop_codon:yes gene_type:complete
MEPELKEKTTLKNYKVRVKDTVEIFTKNLFYALFQNDNEEELLFLKETFVTVCTTLAIDEGEVIWHDFKKQFKVVRELLDLDAIAIENNDPAAKSLEEVYLAYPGFYAIAIYRLSHALYMLDVPLIPRMMSEHAHGLTGIDIHPGAQIGESFFIDHGTGIVIGETAIIKNNVKIYQGVTLGGIQVKKSFSQTKRHPTIEANVIIYANATILGGDVVVGANSIVGANVCLTESVPEDSILTYQKEFKIRKRTDD